MTVIAFDGKTLAADTQAFRGDVRYGHVNKIHKINDQEYIGCCGATEEIIKVIKWIKGGEKPSLNPDNYFSGILLNIKTGEVRDIYYDLEFSKPPTPAATGCGMYFALTAMHCGKSAIEAVKVAIKLNVYCGGDIESVTVGGIYTEDKPFDVEKLC